jgi:hypothetical protein
MNDNFDEIINFLLTVIKEENGIDKLKLLLEAEKSEFNIEKSKISLKYFDFMIEKDLISFDVDNRFRITKKGLDIFNMGGWIKHIEIEKNKADFLAEKEILDFEKSKVDLDLAKKMLKEFPKTRLFSRIGLFIAIVLALKELYILVKPLL